MTKAEDAMLTEALRIKTSPTTIGNAIGCALVRRFGRGRAYDAADAVLRGIQDTQHD